MPPTTGRSGAGQGRLGVWRETGILDRFPAGGLPVDLAYARQRGLRGTGGGRRGACSSPTPGASKANQAIERVVALDERTGRRALGEGVAHRLQRAAARLRHRPARDADGRRRSRVRARRDGRICSRSTQRPAGSLWQKDYVKDFNASVPTWGMAGAPLVDGDRLICLVGGEPDAKVIALNKHTGEEVWRSLSSDTEPGYNQPIIIEAGRRATARALSPERPQLARSGDRQGVLGNRAHGPDGHRRRHAGAERTVSVLHVAVRRRAHASARRREAGRRARLERAGRAGSRA